MYEARSLKMSDVIGDMLFVQVFYYFQVADRRVCNDHVGDRVDAESRLKEIELKRKR